MDKEEGDRIVKELLEEGYLIMPLQIVWSNDNRMNGKVTVLFECNNKLMRDSQQHS